MNKTLALVLAVASLGTLAVTTVRFVNTGSDNAAQTAGIKKLEWGIMDIPAWEGDKDKNGERRAKTVPEEKGAAFGGQGPLDWSQKPCWAEEQALLAAQWNYDALVRNRAKLMAQMAADRKIVAAGGAAAQFAQARLDRDQAWLNGDKNNKGANAQVQEADAAITKARKALEECRKNQANAAAKAKVDAAKAKQGQNVNAVPVN